mmetsp:Transcript_39373/g.117842  ORF Transcript_39373/g.117842 Transcript_39373/m.117842 type:complete len:368 (-) Transcript_39373:53-1156(-)
MPAIADAAPFSGLWGDDAGRVVTVRDAKATGPGGEALEFVIVSRKKCALRVASKVSQGTLAGDGSRIAWSDGSVWTRLSEGEEGEASSGRLGVGGGGLKALEGPGAEELASWLRAVDGPKLANYWPKMCELVSGVEDLRDRYADRPQDFLVDLGVEHPGHRSAFTRALRVLRRVDEPAAEAEAVSPLSPGVCAAPGNEEAEPQQTAVTRDGDGGLTLDGVLRLQRELYVAFSDDDFRRRLADVEHRHGTARENYSPAHTQLFLSVQNDILPKYGFPEGQAGVLAMLKASARFNGNRQFLQNRARLNQLLGLAPPRGEGERHLAEIAAQQEDRLTSLPQTAQLRGLGGAGLPVTALAGQPPPSAGEPS